MNNTCKFQVGDRVRIHGHPNTPLNSRVGKVYGVRTNYLGEVWYVVQLDGERPCGRAFPAKYLSRHEYPDLLVPGDLVVVRETGTADVVVRFTVRGYELEDHATPIPREGLYWSKSLNELARARNAESYNRGYDDALSRAVAAIKNIE